MLLLGIAALCAVATLAAGKDMSGPGMSPGMGDMGGMHGMGMQAGMQPDGRVSLGLQGPRKQHQLAMMRSHLEAVGDIVDAIALGKFDRASETARLQLGLTPQMKKMCNGFKNEDFRKLGLAFHASADDLARVLKTHDTAASLQALHTTMQYCTSCHRTYRQ